MLGWELQEGWWGGNYKRNAGTVITGGMVGRELSEGWWGRNYRRDDGVGNTGGVGVVGGMVG